MTTVQRRAFNNHVTRFWSAAAKAYNWAPLQRWIYQPAQDEMVTLVQSRNSQRIIDIACGTGILASRIQEEIKPQVVCGVDMSEGMLAQAKERSAAVSWQKAPAERLPFDNDTFDAVLSTSAFHFFDQPAAVAEFYRVLAAGGLLAVATLSPHKHPLPRLQGWFNQRLPARMPTPPEMRTLLQNCGFRIAMQRPVRRSVTPPLMSADWITVGIKP